VFSTAQPESELYGIRWDGVSQTPWYCYHDGTNWHQVWFDNAQSIGLKYQLAKDHNLQGVGTWALGFDDGRNELWATLQQYFSYRRAGDTNCDGELDVADIAAFALAVVDPAGYAAAYPACNPDRADMNGDGLVDGLDIQTFVNALLGS
jgi:hypothetical protein